MKKIKIIYFHLYFMANRIKHFIGTHNSGGSINEKYGAKDIKT